MCVALAASGDDFRFVVTDLGFNARDGGELVHQSVSKDRLRWLGTGWGVGSGDARVVHWSLDEIEDASDAEGVRQVVQRCAERAEQFPHDPDMLWESTNLLTATPGGVAKFKPDGTSEVWGDRHYFLLTPPGVADQAEELNQHVAGALANDVRCALPVAEALVRWVTDRSTDTCPEYAVGLLVRDPEDESAWHHKGFRGTVEDQ